MKTMIGISAAFFLVAASTGCESGRRTHEDSSEDVDAQEDAREDVEELEDSLGDVEDAQDGPDVLACDLPDRTFWTWDLTGMPPGNIQMDAACRGIGEHVAVYVSDDVWGVNMDEQDVIDIVEAFESSTPADPGQGIYDILTGTFGDPPDVDSDPRIVLFYHSLGSYMGSAFDGFFRAQDETTCGTCNATEMLFLEAVHNPVAEPYMLSIIAHELQHMIHWQADPNEHSWIDEAMSEAAMAACGYFTDEANVRAFLFSPDSSLVTTSLVDYGAEFLFGLYLTEQLGPVFLSELVAEPSDGIEGLDLTAVAYSTDMNTLFSDWVLANYIEDPAMEEGQWGYETYDIAGLAVDAASPDGVLRTETLNGWAADYNLYSLAASGADLVVRVDSGQWASLGATLITMSTSEAVDPVVTPIGLLSDSTEETLTVTAGHDRAVLVVFALAEGSFSYQHSTLW